MLLCWPSTKLYAPTFVDCVHVPINADDSDTHCASLNLATRNTSQSVVPIIRVQRRIFFTYQLQANAVSTIDTEASEINKHAHSRNDTLLVPSTLIAATINWPTKSMGKSTTPTNTNHFSHGCQCI